MASPIKTSIKSTYSFAKLNRSINKILRESTDILGKAGESILKERIDSSKDEKGRKFPPLTRFTMNQRKRGIGWNGKKVKKTSSETPLKQTGALYRSLTYVKKDQQIKMKSYGKMHNDGFVNDSGIAVPPRPFMGLEGSNVFETLSRGTAIQPIKNKLKKAFKK